MYIIKTVLFNLVVAQRRCFVGLIQLSSFISTLVPTLALPLVIFTWALGDNTSVGSTFWQRIFIVLFDKLQLFSTVESHVLNSSWAVCGQIHFLKVVIGLKWLILLIWQTVFMQALVSSLFLRKNLSLFFRLCLLITARCCTSCQIKIIHGILFSFHCASFLLLYFFVLLTLFSSLPIFLRRSVLFIGNFPNVYFPFCVWKMHFISKDDYWAISWWRDPFNYSWNWTGVHASVSACSGGMHCHKSSFSRLRTTFLCGLVRLCSSACCCSAWNTLARMARPLRESSRAWSQGTESPQSCNITQASECALDLSCARLCVV